MADHIGKPPGGKSGHGRHGPLIFCAVCGQIFDSHDRDQTQHHQTSHHEPLLRSGDGWHLAGSDGPPSEGEGQTE